MNIFERRYETMPRAELEQLQLERLQALLVRLKRNVRRYRERLPEAPIESLPQIATLPFTTSEDITKSFPFGLFAFPLREIIRLHTTAGPGGQPLVIGHTRNDLNQWSRLVARQLVAVGVTASDVLQISLGSALSSGAAGYVLGAEHVEASVIAEDPFHIDYQLAMLQNYRPTVLVTTPSHAFDLIRMIEQRQVDPQSLHLRTILLTRPAPGEMRERIAAGLFAQVRSSFGLGEVLDPGLCVECAHGKFHVHEDHFLVEVVDGELVLTTLTREALPLLRFRTRVAATLLREKCACGRTTAMLEPGARLDGRLLVNEIPLYHSQIAEVLAATRIAGQPFEAEVAERHLVLRIRMAESVFSDTIWTVEKLARDIQSEFLSRVGIEAQVRFVEPRSWTGQGSAAPTSKSV